MLHPSLAPSQSPIHGTGLFAREPIEAGEVVWRGPHQGLMSLAQLMANMDDDGLHSQVDIDLFCPCSPLEWCMNHSCAPNTVMSDRALWSTRPIVTGEEICYDYGVTEVSLLWWFECDCGAEHCRRIVSNQDFLLPLLRRTSTSYASELALKASSGEKLRYRIRRWQRMMRLSLREK
ncbi:SET domain-containing protein [Halioglobus maricola]|uniref:SET domain-containing protein n=1 Tax=Halioglobus maricola TaxID=2601894 RepID=A0A5P9NFP9_9GAMM|nr:SET domain-containing protein [Halioglobus maricola]QFU74602.1 SET domain-containing protein [Halioglobus maricola]